MFWLCQHHSSFRAVVGFREGPAPGNDKGLRNKVCMISECNLTVPERNINSSEKPVAIDLDQTWHLPQNRYSVHKHPQLTYALTGA